MSLTEASIEKPISGVEVFRATEDPSALLSRAAWILCLGRQIRVHLQPRIEERFPGLVPEPEPLDPEEAAEWGEIGVPALEAKLDFGGREQIREQYGIKEGEAANLARFVDLAYAVEKSRNPYDALALFECGIQHPDRLTRVCSAIAYRNWTSGPVSTPLLVQCVDDTDELIATLARDELARVAPEHRALSRYVGEEPPLTHGRSHTSLLVHGTGARFAKWWQPGGDFHDYLLQHVVPDLYAGADRYGWSGGWTDHARAMAAIELGGWLARHSIPRLNKLAGHSHGGNVAMAATHGTTAADQLVLLSCPVHERKYLPNFANVGEVVSFQVHLDLAVLADRGRLKFRHPNVRNETIPLWFNHGASHDERVWRKYALPGRL